MLRYRATHLIGCPTLLSTSACTSEWRARELATFLRLVDSCPLSFSRPPSLGLPRASFCTAHHCRLGREKKRSYSCLVNSGIRKPKSDITVRSCEIGCVFNKKRKSKSEPVAIYLSLRRLLYREGRTRGTTHYILMLPCCPFRSLTLFFHSLLSRLFFVCQQILSPTIPSCYPVIAISLKNSTTNGQCYLCLAALCRCRVMH